MEDAGEGVISTIPDLNSCKLAVTGTPEDTCGRNNALDINIDYVIRPAGRARESIGPINQIIR